MYELTVHGHFDAAHYLKGYQGKCANIHGHTWQVEAKIRGNDLNQTGMLVDFSLIKNELKAITGQLDHVLINDLTCFRDTNPTAENISRYIYFELTKLLKKYYVRLHSVTVWESPGAAATYFERE
ncbi:MAG: 6-carboxytetrahydropterin synthase QueD [Dehalobacterium sp.]